MATTRRVHPPAGGKSGWSALACRRIVVKITRKMWACQAGGDPLLFDSIRCGGQRTVAHS